MLPVTLVLLVENKGFEVNADFNKFGDFIWGVKGNLSYNKNKIIEDDTPSKPYPWMESRGTSVGQRLGYICDSFYTDDDIKSNPDVAKTVEPVMAGDLKYRDLNGDNVIDDYMTKLILCLKVPFEYRIWFWYYCQMEKDSL